MGKIQVDIFGETFIMPPLAENPAYNPNPIHNANSNSVNHKTNP